MINNIKDLKQLIKLCREQGIDAIEVGEIKVSLGAVPYKVPRVTKTKQTEASYSPGGNLPDTKVTSDDNDIPSEDDMLYWSTSN